ncbi:MAG: adenylate/guanylate cyclase domain-containing protein [Chloroflexota bacterium]|nr:adenylate/guanylate cyclase domain-containing protein [Chloroflexota bacterium]
MLRDRKSRQRAVLAAIIALSTLLSAYFVDARYFNDNLQSAVYDFVITAAPAKVKNQVTVVALDDATVEKYGRWPLPRQAYVDLLNALKPLNAKAIGFDIAFYDPSDNPTQDIAFAAAIKDLGNVYLAMQGVGEGTYGGHAQTWTSVKLPIPALRDAAAGLGAVNVNPETDSRVREAQMVIRGPDGKPYYGLALLTASRQIGGQVDKIRISGDDLIMPTAAFGDRVVPLTPGGSTRVYFAAPPHDAVKPMSQGGAVPCARPDAFCVVSMLDVINGKVPRELILGRTVFVGAHGLSAEPDNYPVPNSAQQKMWGVEIWANTAQSIFTNRYPVPDQGFLITLVEVVLLTVAGIFLVVRLRLVGFLLGLVMLAVFSFAELGAFISSVSPAIGNGPVAVPSLGYLPPSVFWWVMTLGYLLVEEQLAVARTQSTFGRFVTPAVARTILETEEKGGLQLGGQMREITVLFGDIRGFTSLSEGMEPQTLMATLNRYFDGMVEVVNRYQGTVNKYNGDNIMVIWNAPVEVSDHPHKAVECAIEIQKFVVSERAKGGPDVSFGFGINTGPAVAGFLGAYGRMEYTVIGDTVNVASRLTSNDIARRDQVACSKETLARLGDDVVAIDLGAIFVKGRNEPVACYQVDRVGLAANPNPAPPPEIPVGRAAVAGFH